MEVEAGGGGGGGGVASTGGTGGYTMCVWGGASTGWNGPRGGEVSQCGSAASKEKGVP